MAVTRKAGLPPLIMPSDAAKARKAALAGSSTAKAKASGAPGLHHVRIRRGEAARGAGVEHIIASASPMGLAAKP